MIHLVTDSSADIPADLLKQYGIYTVPLTIRVNGKEFEEGVNITPQEFYREMYSASQLPQTSQPTPERFKQLFQDLAGKGTVLCLTLSSKLSGSYVSALMGAELSGNPDVIIFDTLGASIGHGMQVLRAAELAKAGCSSEEILASLTRMRDEMKFLLLFDTLENIVKGGRLSYFQGSLGKLLNIKIILHNVEGAVELLEKVRGRSKSMQRVIDMVGEYCPDLNGRTVGISHVDNYQDAVFMAEAIEKRYHPSNIIINEMGPTIATYVGKDGLIIAFERC
jgi:DegV family protein with EDD domain